MLKVREELKKYDIRPLKYTNLNNVLIVESINGKYVCKEGNSDIFEYLRSRDYSYYPVIISSLEDKYMITKYIDNINIPEEQKLDDIIDLVSLLHSKTTHFKDIDQDEYKKMYEDLNNNIIYLYGYYNDLMNIIESKIYMSPKEYYLARNISLIYMSLYHSKRFLDSWYRHVKDSKEKRVTFLHNNLKLEHYLHGDAPYLISWNKSKIDMPIFDLYKLYKNEGDKINFKEMLERYERQYPLDEKERCLLFTLLLEPDIKILEDEFEGCVSLYKEFQKLNKVLDTLPYYFKD